MIDVIPGTLLHSGAKKEYENIIATFQSDESNELAHQYMEPNGNLKPMLPTKGAAMLVRILLMPCADCLFKGCYDALW
jgi:hypothetical protein